MKITTIALFVSSLFFFTTYGTEPFEFQKLEHSNPCGLGSHNGNKWGPCIYSSEHNGAGWQLSDGDNPPPLEGSTCVIQNIGVTPLHVEVIRFYTSIHDFQTESLPVIKPGEEFSVETKDESFEKMTKNIWFHVPESSKKLGVIQEFSLYCGKFSVS